MLDIDYHIHTTLCGHAQGEMEDYVKQAISIGLREIAFTDHLPFSHLPAGHPWHGKYAMQPHQLPAYCLAVLELKHKYPQIIIKLGIEVDYIPGQESQVKKVLSQYPFDFVLGSIHMLDGWSFDDPNEIDKYDLWDLDELWNKYFQTFIKAVQTGLYDSMAHPDLIKKFGFFPLKPVQNLYEQAAQALHNSQVCVEINSSGLRKPVEEIYPGYQFLQACHTAGVPVTVGSDAHHPSEVGKDFLLVESLLKEIGYEQVATFNNRKMQLQY